MWHIMTPTLFYCFFAQSAVFIYLLHKLYRYMRQRVANWFGKRVVPLILTFTIVTTAYS